MENPYGQDKNGLPRSTKANTETSISDQAPPLEITPSLGESVKIGVRDSVIQSKVLFEDIFKTGFNQIGARGELAWETLIGVIDPSKQNDEALVDSIDTIDKGFFTEFKDNLSPIAAKYTDEYKELLKKQQVLNRQGSWLKKNLPGFVSSAINTAPEILLQQELGTAKFLQGSMESFLRTTGFDTTKALSNRLTRYAANGIDVGSSSVIASFLGEMLGIKESLIEAATKDDPELANFHFERLGLAQEFALGSAFGVGASVLGDIVKPIARSVGERVNHWVSDSKDVKNVKDFKYAAENFDNIFNKEGDVSTPTADMNLEFDDIGNAQSVQEATIAELGKDSGTLDIKGVKIEFDKQYEQNIKNKATENINKQIEALEQKGNLTEEETAQLASLKSSDPADIYIDPITKMDEYGDYVEQELHKMFRENNKNVLKQAQFHTSESARVYGNMYNMLPAKGEIDLVEGLNIMFKDEDTAIKGLDSIIEDDFSGLETKEFQSAKALQRAWGKTVELNMEAGIHKPSVVRYTYFGWDGNKVKAVPAEVFITEVEAGSNWKRMQERGQESLQWAQQQGDKEAIKVQEQLLKDMETLEGRRKIVSEKRDGIITGDRDNEIVRFFSRRRQTILKTHAKFFFPKDGKSLYDLLAKYGYGNNPLASINIGLKGAARSIATARVFGTKGWEVVGNFIKELPESKNEFSTISGIMRLYKNMTLPLGDASTGWTQNVFDSFKNVSSSAKLAFIVKYALFEDFKTAFLNTFNAGVGGKNFFREYTRFFKKNLGLTEEQYNKMLHQTLMTRERFTTQDFLENTAPFAKLRDFTMKIQGVEWVTKRNQNIAALTWQSRMGEFLGKDLSWEQLPKKWKEWSVRDGITKSNYELIREYKDLGLEKVDNYDYFLWQKVYDNAPNAKVKAAADAFGSALIAYQERSVIGASRITQAYSYLGRPMRRDNIPSMLFDSFMSFTDSPLQIFHSLYEKDPIKRAALSLLPSIAVGLLIESAEALVAGDVLKFDPQNGRGMWWHGLNAAIKGGWLGLPADMAWHVGSALYDNLIDKKRDPKQTFRDKLGNSLIGATLSTGMDLASIPFYLAQGKTEKAIENAIKLLPANNNPMVAAVLQNYILPEYYHHHTKDGGWQHYKNKAKSRQLQGRQPISSSR